MNIKFSAPWTENLCILKKSRRILKQAFLLRCILQHPFSKGRGSSIHHHDVTWFYMCSKRLQSPPIVVIVAHPAPSSVFQTPDYNLGNQGYAESTRRRRPRMQLIAAAYAICFLWVFGHCFNSIGLSLSNPIYSNSYLLLFSLCPILIQNRKCRKRRLK